MEIINKIKQFKKLKKNQFLGVYPKLENSTITFNGEGNIIFCEDQVVLKNSNIVFNGNNSIIYLSTNKHPYLFQISINNNSTCYFGTNNYINKPINIIISEEKNVIIGNHCLFSLNVWFRVADPHLIYNISDKKRVNLSKSIYIGDHVWVGQNVMLLKGCQIGSGSILAANSVISNKKVPSNTVWGGNPIRELKKDIFWDGACVHSWTKKDTESRMYFETDQYTYTKDKTSISFDKIEKELASLETSSDKLEYIKLNLKNNSKNRFYI